MASDFEVETLERSIESVSPLAGEVIVGVDTASRDGTRELAERLADQVVMVDFQGEHNGDFASARNQLLRFGTGTWCLSIDGHEFLTGDGAPKLAALLATDANGYDGIAFRLQMSENEGGVHAMVLRCWRRSEGIQWMRPIHETLSGIGNAVLGCPHIVIRHERSHRRIAARQQQRRSSDLALLLAELNDKPDDPTTLWHIASILGDEEPDAAAEYAARALGESDGKKDTFKCQLVVFLARTAMNDGRLDEARELVWRSLAMVANNPEAYCLLGEIAAQTGDLDMAAFFFETASRVPSVPLELPIGRRYYTWFPRYQLGRLAIESGRMRSAASQFQAVAKAEIPDDVRRELEPWVRFAGASSTQAGG